MRYNTAFQMTSFGAGRNLTEFGYTTTYTIQGQLYHPIGSLLPTSDLDQPKFAQMYFMGDGETQQKLTISDAMI